MHVFKKEDDGKIILIRILFVSQEEFVAGDCFKSFADALRGSSVAAWSELQTHLLLFYAADCVLGVCFLGMI